MIDCLSLYGCTNEYSGLQQQSTSDLSAASDLSDVAGIAWTGHRLRVTSTASITNTIKGRAVVTPPAL